jgi:hypothetical protein
VAHSRRSTLDSLIRWYAAHSRRSTLNSWIRWYAAMGPWAWCKLVRGSKQSAARTMYPYARIKRARATWVPFRVPTRQPPSSTRRRQTEGKRTVHSVRGPAPSAQRRRDAMRWRPLSSSASRGSPWLLHHLPNPRGSDEPINARAVAGVSAELFFPAPAMKVRAHSLNDDVKTAFGSGGGPHMVY